MKKRLLNHHIITIRSSQTILGSLPIFIFSASPWVPHDAADMGEACGEMDMGLAAKASNLTTGEDDLEMTTLWWTNKKQLKMTIYSRFSH